MCGLVCCYYYPACCSASAPGKHSTEQGLALISTAEEIEQGRSHHQEIIRTNVVYDDPGL
jgi:hypothetical protein